MLTGMYTVHISNSGRKYNIMNERDIKGQYASKRYGRISKIVLLLFVAVVGVFIFLGQIWLPKNLVEATNTEVITIDRTPEKIEAAKVATVAMLETCESAGHTPEEGIVILDTNNKMSFGVLQLQKDHIKNFYKKLYGKEVSGQEAVIIAITPEMARSLTKDVLFQVEDGWREWYNCGIKLELKGRIELIEELEK